MKALTSYVKYLAWVGLALIVAGLVASAISGWDWLTGSLLLVGLVLILVGISFGDQILVKFWGQRSTQAGTNALIATLAILFIFGLVNFLGVRYSTRIDLTENQILTLAPQSQELARQLDRPIRIVIFDTTPNPQDEQLLENYRRLNPQFSYEYLDPFANPVVSQQFGVKTVGEVYLEDGDKRRLLQQISPEERLSERRLTTELDQIVRDRTPTVYFLQGHGEYVTDGSQKGLAEAAAALEEKGYVVTPLNLAQIPNVPEDAAAVIVAGPKQAFFEKEVDALQSYLDQGGNLMLMVDPNTATGLDTLLATWGVTLEDRVVIDISGGGQLVGLGPAAPLVTDYGDHPITADFGNGRSFYPLARPVDITEVPGVTATPLLLTNPESRAEEISESGELQFDPNQPSQGPLNLGVALSRPVDEANDETSANPAADPPAAEGTASTEGTGEPDELDEAGETTPEEATEKPEARLVVIGNASFATDGLFNQQLNGDVFLNAVSWLSQQDDATLSIRPREVTDRRIFMTPSQQLVMAVSAILILPLAGLGAAVVMWLRRR